MTQQVQSGTAGAIRISISDAAALLPVIHPSLAKTPVRKFAPQWHLAQTACTEPTKGRGVVVRRGEENCEPGLTRELTGGVNAEKKVAGRARTSSAAARAGFCRQLWLTRRSFMLQGIGRQPAGAESIIVEPAVTGVAPPPRSHGASSSSPPISPRADSDVLLDLLRVFARFEALMPQSSSFGTRAGRQDVFHLPHHVGHVLRVVLVHVLHVRSNCPWRRITRGSSMSGIGSLSHALPEPVPWRRAARRSGLICLDIFCSRTGAAGQSSGFIRFDQEVEDDPHFGQANA